ncbi:GNAT family N-acetyltransferase [Pelagicoccus sp. SDUM812002]|uniref:GNAT family N-acetyltransferase n=1 Tax=Pelagicoccus sp. SDUM812002 TaxID=3041266 RepID=UPI00280F9643|nr:GNAT family N-acetyltransferase [Pelagicoccus sp. SDUM812002]MDQ8188602.1 GNAT family N-acetyltransferase [Pelagicoccus sp. SDUM812002]
MNVNQNNLVDCKEISEIEFTDLKNLWMNDYAISFARSGLMDQKTASNRAAEMWSKTFEEGKETKGHLIRTIIDYDSKHTVGYIWVSQFYPNQKKCFLSYLHVKLDFRRRGFGKAAMEMIDIHLKRNGITEMTLNVFSDNQAARALYSSLGYSEALVTMRKEL